MQWMIILMVFAGAIAAGRAYQLLLRARANTQEDWDAKLVKEFRAAGGNAFTLCDIDFFFHMPDETNAGAVRSVLEADGFTVDSRALDSETIGTGFSLHACKSMRVSESAMQEHSKRFRALAEQHGGHYDGWAAARRLKASSRSGV